MSSAHFSIAYDGPALSSGSMDVRDLAPALLAIGQLFDAGNSALNGDAANISVEVRATAQGSFEIAFDLVQTFGQQIIGLLTGDDVTAAIHLKELIVTGACSFGGLIWLVKKLRGKTPDRLEKVDADNVRVTIGDESFVVPLKLLRLYQNIAVREAAQKVVEEPLKKDGIEEFKVLDNEGKIIQSVHKSEAHYFSKPDVQEVIILDETHRAAFSIVSLAFKEDNKWRLNDGNTQISAIINDEDFIRKVDTNQVSFSKGDILVCDVNVVQKQTKDGLKTEYVVERVIEHKHAERQLSFLIEESRPARDEKA